MNIIAKTPESSIARVYVAEDEAGRKFEFVESTQPPLTIQDKWVLILSTLYGCPVGCTFCDAGGQYKGRIGLDGLRFQVDTLVKERWQDGLIDTGKFKIQFARMGEPSFNPHVLEFLEEIPTRYLYRSFIPSLSTIGAAGTEGFFTKLLSIKKRLYDRDFQLQFSIHTLDEAQRDLMIPVKKMGFREIVDYADRFYSPEGKKITLNFALAEGSLINAETMLKHFDPNLFLIKITPVNPTFKAIENNVSSLVTKDRLDISIVQELREAGYEVILSIGEWEENRIGSNCGQYIQSMEQGRLENAYCYEIKG
ncbi:MAG: radical SAM protein [Bacteroidetes bacterium]|nr:radical SAM protein [Bacteroidota bacterium]